jgi:hypothetical protein
MAQSSQVSGGGSQSSQRAGGGSQSGQTDARISDLVQYLLVMDQKKLPIKKLGVLTMNQPITNPITPSPGLFQCNPFHDLANKFS